MDINGGHTDSSTGEYHYHNGKKEQQNENYLVGKVIGVSDGDTIKILVDGKPYKVRLFGIDCPEKTQDFGTKAKNFVSSICYGKIVKVEDRGTDRYKRTLGKVFLEDGMELNKEILKEGLAWWYEKYSPNEREYKELEKQAKEKKIGLWSDSNPINPNEYRKSKRKN